MIFGLLTSWYLQDSFAVLSADALLVPDIYLLCVLYNCFSGFARDEDNEVFLLWAAFLGGALWDLRWIGVPGLFAFIYAGTYLCSAWAWSLFPESGHTVEIFFLILWASQLPGFFTGLLLWNIEARYYISSILVCQAYSVPLSAFCSLLYARKLKLRNA